MTHRDNRCAIAHSIVAASLKLGAQRPGCSRERFDPVEARRSASAAQMSDLKDVARRWTRISRSLPRRGQAIGIFQPIRFAWLGRERDEHVRTDELDVGNSQWGCLSCDDDIVGSGHCSIAERTVDAEADSVRSGCVVGMGDRRCAGVSASAIAKIPEPIGDKSGRGIGESDLQGRATVRAIGIETGRRNEVAIGEELHAIEAQTARGPTNMSDLDDVASPWHEVHGGEPWR